MFNTTRRAPNGRMTISASRRHYRDVVAAAEGKRMRPRKCRIVQASPAARFFKPRGIPMCALEVVALKDEEWEAIRLADYEKLDQATAARQMGVSRPTFSRVLASARTAVAKALAEGSALAIGGGDFLLQCRMPAKAKRCPPATRS
jgi:uncharacterized protein